MVVTVKKIGGSMAIVIPRQMATDAGLEPGTSVDMSRHEDGILVRKHGRPRRPIEQIVKEIDAAAYARHSKLVNDSPVGKEIW